MTLRIAVVGSGPAGLYCAEKLLRDAPGAAIDVIEKLPTPFGLVRAGVAPDHQGTKAVIRVFERLLRREEVGFFGNVAVGEAVALEELRQLYDAVVIATGALSDRALGIPGEGLDGLWGSARFVGWYNGLPVPGAPPALERVRSAVVIGNGNVALDVARVLAKVPAEMARSDLDPEAEKLIAAAPLREIAIVGRRGAADAKFSPVELAELGRLARAAPVVDAADLPPDAAADTPVLKVLRAFAAAASVEKPVHIRFRFACRPERIEGEESRVAAAVFRRMARAPSGWVATEETLRLSADLVVTCVGYECEGCGGLAPADGVIANEGGRVADGLYVVGWAKRGPSGTIPTNRSEAHEVAQRILAATGAGGREGRDGLKRLLERRGVDVVDWRRWTLIDQHEIAAAGPDRVRRKLRSLEALLRVGRDGR